jgi:hypothetical protein
LIERLIACIATSQGSATLFKKKIIAISFASQHQVTDFLIVRQTFVRFQ